MQTGIERLGGSMYIQQAGDFPTLGTDSYLETGVRIFLSLQPFFIIIFSSHVFFSLWTTV